MFLVMTHSSTLYEREVGASLDVNGEKKKTTVRPFSLPKASHIKHQIERTTTTKKKTVSTVGEYCWEGYLMVTLQDLIHRPNR